MESNKKDFKETDVWDSEDDDWGDEKYIPPLLRIRLQGLYEARKEGNNNGILL